MLALVALWTFGACSAFRSLVASVPLLPLLTWNPLGALRPGIAPLASLTLGALRSPVPLVTLWPLRSPFTSFASLPLLTLGSHRTHWTGWTFACEKEEADQSDDSGPRDYPSEVHFYSSSAPVTMTDRFSPANRSEAS